MKKMKLFSLAALLLAGAAFTACSSDNDIADEQQNVNTTGKYTLTIKAAKGDVTRALAVDDINDDGKDDLVATWAVGDQVTVYNETKKAALGGYLEAETSGAETTLTGDLEGTIEVGDELTLKFLSANYNNQQGTLAYVAANCDYAVASVEVAGFSGGNIIPVASTTTFTNQQAILKLTLQDKGNGNAAISPSELTVSDATSTVELTTIPAATYTTNGDGVLYVAFPAAGVSKTITLTATVGDDTYTYEKSGVTFNNGEFYDITVKMTKQVSYPIISTVTTSDYGKVVCAAGHLHDANTPVPAGCTGVGVIAKVTDGGHGLIMALQDAEECAWGNINWCTSVTYAGSTMKRLDSWMLGSLPSYTSLGSISVSNWCVAQKSDYETMFANLGSTHDNSFDDNVNAKIKSAGGTVLSDGDSYWGYWCATQASNGNGWSFKKNCWDDESYYDDNTIYSKYLRPVLGF